ncbi:MAG: hypothetical protein QOE70_1717 [Chthoniobacter sp.]|jgi:uncharacterized membrane protein|nr:hypothetical protein [Chthoniobacter sp.]
MIRKLVRRLSYLEAHHRLGLSLGVAIAVFVFAGSLTLSPRLIVSWDAYALCFSGFAWTRIFAARPKVIVRLARIRYTSRKLILLFVLFAACASLGAVAILLGTAKGLPPSTRTLHVTLAVGTVVLSWFLVHTVFALHYAHIYYRRCLSGEPLGLSFPGTAQPNYHDFAYFSFVIGMTSQVSDVQIQSSEIRRWALLHGIISFGFNAAVLALGINVISGLF